MTASVPHLLAQSSNQGNPIFTFVLLGLMMGALYFFMIRPAIRSSPTAAFTARSTSSRTTAFTSKSIATWSSAC